MPNSCDVAVIGMGISGLTLALDLIMKGHKDKICLLEKNEFRHVGSRAITYTKHSLEIFDRLGCADEILERGIPWTKGRQYYGDVEVNSPRHVTISNEKFTTFAGLPQSELEEILIAKIDSLAPGWIRWRTKLTNITWSEGRTVLEVETDFGRDTIDCKYLIAADGAHSFVRWHLDLEFIGEAHSDHFLITDVVIEKPLPYLRKFWFSPPFHTGHSALMLMQRRNRWRLDFQLGRDIDRETELNPDIVAWRVRRMLGEDCPFTIEEASIYTFGCKRLSSFVHGNTVFLGDAAHIVSPFGARGANGAVQDANNLGWKLDLILRDLGQDGLLESYDAERTSAAALDVMNASRSAAFISPPHFGGMALRNAVLTLSKRHAFAREFINTGRFPAPATYETSQLNAESSDAFDNGVRPGQAVVDAPIWFLGSTSWLVDQIAGRFSGVLYLAESGDRAVARSIDKLAKFVNSIGIPVSALVVVDDPASGISERFPQLRFVQDRDHVLKERYGLCLESFYLIRPDAYVLGRWLSFEPRRVYETIDKCIRLEIAHVCRLHDDRYRKRRNRSA